MCKDHIMGNANTCVAREYLIGYLHKKFCNEFTLHDFESAYFYNERFLHNKSSYKDWCKYQLDCLNSKTNAELDQIKFGRNKDNWLSDIINSNSKTFVKSV